MVYSLRRKTLKPIVDELKGRLGINVAEGFGAYIDLRNWLAHEYLVERIRFLAMTNYERLPEVVDELSYYRGLFISLDSAWSDLHRIMMDASGMQAAIDKVDEKTWREIFTFYSKTQQEEIAQGFKGLRKEHRSPEITSP